MSSPTQNTADGANSSNIRTLKPRPEPLGLPPDRRYGTLSDSPRNRNDSRRASQSMTRRSTESIPLWNYVASPQSPLIKIRDHCHQQWVAVVLTLILLGVTCYFVFGLSAPMRADRCVTPFGTLLGENSAIAAYSNCRSDYGGDRMEHFVSVGLQRLYTGAKWHALEYARRYWILSSLLTFPSLTSPDDLLTVHSATAVNGRRGGRGSPVVMLEHYKNMFLPHQVQQENEERLRFAGNETTDANGVSPRALLMNRRLALPLPRDLVVYAKSRKLLPQAHVAVVVAVRGPFRSVAAAGKDVHWYLVKNATFSGRQPMAPEATLPHALLNRDKGANAATDGDNNDNNNWGQGNAAPAPGQENIPDGSSVLYYAIYVAEQNWDNTYWESPAELQLQQEQEEKKLQESASAGEAGKEAPPKQVQKAAAAVAAKQRNYSRVLLLHEYSSPHGFFLEDTINNPILGWVRASSE